MNHYTLGSIWKRRDGKQAVVISEPLAGLVRVITVAPVGQPVHDSAYLVHTSMGDHGRVSKGGHDSPMDLIYRDESEAQVDLVDAANAVVAAWGDGDLAGAVRELDRAVRAFDDRPALDEAA